MTRSLHFGNRFGQNLAFFAGKQLPQFLLAREDLIACAVKDIMSLLRTAESPPHSRFLRCRDRLLGFGSSGLGIDVDDVTNI